MGVIANGGDLALSLFVAVVIGGSFVVLGGICWVFWRAAKREADERREQGTPK
jgi:cbb3-type cytochrome oxidase subunit 3